MSEARQAVVGGHKEVVLSDPKESVVREHEEDVGGHKEAVMSKSNETDVIGSAAESSLSTRAGRQVVSYQRPQESLGNGSSVEEQRKKVVSAFEGFMEALAAQVGAGWRTDPGDSGVTPAGGTDDAEGGTTGGTAATTGSPATGTGGYPSTGTEPGATDPSAGDENATSEAAKAEASREAQEMTIYSHARRTGLIVRVRRARRRSRRSRPWPRRPWACRSSAAAGQASVRFEPRASDRRSRVRAVVRVQGQVGRADDREDVGAALAAARDGAGARNRQRCEADRRVLGQLRARRSSGQRCGPRSDSRMMRLEVIPGQMIVCA